MTLFQVLPLLYSVYLVNFKGIISIYLDKLCFFASFHINKKIRCNCRSRNHACHIGGDTSCTCSNEKWCLSCEGDKMTTTNQNIAGKSKAKTESLGLNIMVLNKSAFSTKNQINCSMLDSF